MMMRNRARAARAGETETALADLTRAANESRLRERSPDKFLEALREQGFGDVDIFIPSGAMQEYFQAPFPARSTIGVSALPRGVAFEADAVMVLD